MKLQFTQVTVRTDVFNSLWGGGVVDQCYIIKRGLYDCYMGDEGVENCRFCVI